MLRPRCQNFGLGLDKFASVLSAWPQKCAIQCKILLVISTSWLYHGNIHYKNVVKCGTKVQLRVVGIVTTCSYSEIFTCGRPPSWPRPQRLGLRLRVLTSAFWLHLTSLQTMLWTTYFKLNKGSSNV